MTGRLGPPGDRSAIRRRVDFFASQHSPALPSPLYIRYAPSHDCSLIRDVPGDA
jgi:hypothetical protein